MLETECPFHPKPKYRECHHLGNQYVAVWWGSSPLNDDEGWFSTLGFIDKPGSMTSWADKELGNQLRIMREGA